MSVTHLSPRICRGNPPVVALGQGGHGGTAPTYRVGGGIFLDAKVRLPKRLDC